VLEYEQPPGALIFCNTRDDTAVIAGYLKRHGYDAEGLSGDLGQGDRERVMGMMKERKLRFLVATDIAARGIDISDLPCVINYTFPESPQIYVHRTGRTGRAGKHGLAISLVAPQELGNFYYLKLLYRIRPEERELPSEAELRTRREGERYARLQREVTVEPGDEWRSLARRVWQSGEGERIVGELVRRSVEALPARQGSVAFEPPLAAPTPPAESRREPRRDRADGPEEHAAREREHGERPSRGDRPARSERPERGERPHRGDRPERGERPRRGDRPERGRRRDGKPPAGKPEARRDEARREEGSREEASPRREPAPSRPEKPAEVSSPPGPVAATDGIDFWETWVDQRSQAPAGAAVDGGATAGDFEDVQLEPGMARLYLNLGRRDRVRTADVEQLLADRVGQSGPPRIQVRNAHTYLVVKEEEADRIIKALTGARHGERELVCERARGR
jgi:ATP-dependent RNA helicase DeaD